MKIHHFRNASFVIETNSYVILVDPMLGPKKEIAPLSFFKHLPKRNPIVNLPSNIEDILKKVNLCILTNTHVSHLDKDGIAFLSKNNIPVIANASDVDFLNKKGIINVQEISDWREIKMNMIDITAIPAQHGYSLAKRLTKEVIGFIITIDKEPSLYITGDTIYNDDIKKALRNYATDITILAAGQAEFDLTSPYSMPLKEIIQFIRDSHGKIIANELGAMNNCAISRKKLRKAIAFAGLSERVLIPEDGEVIDFGEKSDIRKFNLLRCLLATE